MTFAKFKENQFRIDGEIGEKHTIPVNYDFGYIEQYHKIRAWTMIIFSDNGRYLGFSRRIALQNEIKPSK